MGAMATLIEVGDDVFDREVAESKIPVLVEFFSTTCPPCRVMAPVVEELAAQYVDRMKVIKVDVEKSSAVAGRHAVAGVPTLMLFRGGKEVLRAIGAQPRAILAAQLDRALA